MTDLADQIARRASAAGLSPAADVVARCALYIEILAKWNRKMNLTALPIDPPTDAAIDRLIIEPLIAAPFVRTSDRRLVDLGSGGGSPALPLKVAAPWVQLTMIESREKKASFLREAARALSLADVQVRAARIEEALPTIAADVTSVRAVVVNDQISRLVASSLAVDGRVLWFRSEGDGTPIPGFEEADRVALPSGGELRILRPAR